jgi:hypothetical protein
VAAVLRAHGVDLTGAQQTARLPRAGPSRFHVPVVKLMLA